MEGFFSSGKGLEHDVNHSSVSVVEVRKTSKFSSTPSVTFVVWCLCTGTASPEVRGFGISSVEASGPTTR
jgi:hypothetical protein